MLYDYDYVAAEKTLTDEVKVASLVDINVLYLSFIALLSFLTSSYKTSFTYWIETVAFLSTFMYNTN